MRMLHHAMLGAGAVVALAAAQPLHTQAQTAFTDQRYVIKLTQPERDAMLHGMRVYLEALQGITQSLSANNLAGVAAAAKEGGAKLLWDVPPTVSLKVPIEFTSLSLNTHEKFDVLADRAQKVPSRTEVLGDLAAIMANCTGCHAAYRVTVGP